MRQPALSSFAKTAGAGDFRFMVSAMNLAPMQRATFTPQMGSAKSRSIRATGSRLTVSGMARSIGIIKK